MTIKAINPKHQATVNRFLNWDAKYNRLVDDAEGEETPAQERAYNKASELYWKLPRREQINLQKSVDGLAY